MSELNLIILIIFIYLFIYLFHFIFFVTCELSTSRILQVMNVDVGVACMCVHAKIIMQKRATWSLFTFLCACLDCLH